TTRLVLRNLLRHEPLMQAVSREKWDDQNAAFLVDVMVGVHLPEAAVFLAQNIHHSTWEGERLVRQYEHLARYIPSAMLDEVIARAREEESVDIDEQYIRFKGIQQGLARRGEDEPVSMQRWGTVLATELLDKYPAGKEGEPSMVEKQRFAAEL